MQGISAPIYDTLGLDNIKYCINKIGAKYMFVSSEFLPNILSSIKELKSVEHIICFDDIDVEKTKQEAHKIITKLANLGVIVDETASLYSAKSQTSKDEV
jgi:long-subunit acyl-CoA synthetase (AMP-forming)